MLSPADLIFDLDPLWWPLAPADYGGPSNALLADQVIQFLPWQIFVRRWISQGKIPLWNPHSDGGLPFIGNAQSAIFSPFHLVGYLLPLRLSSWVTAVLQIVIAGLFTYLFAREIRIGISGSLLAALTFPFSGPMVGWLGHPHSAVIAWLPAILFATERALTQGSISNSFICGLVISAQFLSGHPETSFHVMLVWAGYDLYRIATLYGGQFSRWARSLGLLLVAAIVGILLSAVQLLPFVEALSHSALPGMRIQGATNSVLHRLLLDWHEWPTLITALLPRYFGTPLNDSYWYPYTNYVEQDIYAGILPLAIALGATLGALRSRSHPLRRQILFFGGLAIIALGIAVRAPLLNLVNFFPFFNLAANGRLRLVYVFAISILAGIGLDQIIHKDIRTDRWMLYALTLGALTSLLLIIAAYFGFYLFRERVISSGRAFIESRWGTDPYLNRPLEYYYALVNQRYAKKLALYKPAHIEMYLPVLVTLAWFVWRSLCKHMRPTLWSLAVIALTYLDLLLIDAPFNPTVKPEMIFPAPEAIRFLQQDTSVYRVCGTGLILYPNSGMVFGLQDVRGYDTVVPGRYVTLVDRLEGHYRYHFHSLFVHAEASLLDLLNVKYLLTDQKPGEKWELVYEDDGPVRVYRNRNVLPRAFIVYYAETVGNAARALDRLLDEQFNFREWAILEQQPLDWSPPQQIPAMAPQVHITIYEPNRVRLDVRTEADGLLVLTDNDAPGWRAFLDGHSVPIYIADYAFRAVVIPAGQHQIEFIYQPWDFYIGALLSMLTAMGLVAYFVWDVKRKRCR